MSCNFSFIFDHPIICKTVKHIDQSDNRFWHVLSFYTLRFSRLTADWSVEKMSSDMTPNGMLFDVSVHCIVKEFFLNRYNKDLILIIVFLPTFVVYGSRSQLPAPAAVHTDITINTTVNKEYT